MFYKNGQMYKTCTFWRKTNCPTVFKIIALDAVVKTKLLYGTDSLQLTEPEINRLEKFHLQAMRKILRWDTTFTNRDNANENIYKEVNKQMENEGRQRSSTLLRKFTNHIK